MEALIDDGLFKSLLQIFQGNCASNKRHVLFLLSNIAAENTHPVYQSKLYDSQLFQIAYDTLIDTN